MELTLFGGFQLCDDSGSAVEVSARKAKALLAWLALHPDKRHPRDRLALLLWEESDDAQARHSLRQTLSGLRKALGEHAEALMADQENVLLKSGPIRVDARQFEALLGAERSSESLSRAVSVYGGEFLEGFNPRSNAYEEWLMTQRSYFRERALGAMGELLEHYLETHQLEAGVRLAIQLLSGDPLQEQVHRTLMQLYVRLNRPADALRQYRQCRRVLWRELGVAPEPKTDRLYREIAQARARRDSEVPSPAPEVTPEPQVSNESVSRDRPQEARLRTEPREAPAQQLRPVTVAHFHLGRYLEQMAEVDPEQAHRKTRDLLQQVEWLVQRYGGQLYHQHGDAIVLLYGLPTAHGNECEKAVQMAVELWDRCAMEVDGLGIRAGVVTGPVVCDEKSAITGAVFAQAEQLARTGQPGDILLSEAAYRGLRLAVEATRRGAATWQITGISTGSKLDSQTMPFVGRTRELRQFAAALQATLEDQAGETFLVRGEAGIGKTRLMEEIAKQAKLLGVVCHRALVLDFGMESRAEPIPILLRQLLSVEESASADEIEVCAKACLGSEWNEALHHPALHALFRLPVTGHASAPGGPPSEEVLQLASQQLLRGILESASQAQPRLLVVEDIHWADQHTLAYLAELAAMVNRCAALLIITSRIEGEPLDPGWRSAMHGAPLTTLDLGPLQQEQTQMLAEQLAGGDGAFIKRCIERSGGNPFFLEQLLWSTAEHDGAVPDSVQSLVLTRLDILSPRDRRAAQAASVLGQRFKLDALCHLLHGSDIGVDALLNQRLIHPEGEGFLFNHALLREGIYASLLASQRRALHLRAAEWYRERDPALYARHLDLANDERAAQAYLRAAQLAVPAFDFEQALELASRGAQITQEPALQAELHNLRGDLLIQAGAIDDANRAHEAAAHSAMDDRSRGRALMGLAAGLTVQDHLDQALAVLDQAEPLAQKSQDHALLTELHCRRGDILFALGRAEECLRAHQQAERLAKRSQAPLLEIRALAGIADAYYARGQMKTAWHYFDRCVELARREKRLPQELANLAMRGLSRFYNGSVSEAVADQWQVARLAAEYGNLRAEMTAYVNLALIYLYTDNLDEAEQAARRGLELAQQLGASRFFGDSLAAIGEVLVLKGQVEEGLEYLERAYQSALDSVPSHTGAFILGVLARVTPNEKRRRQAIADGQRLLDQGSISHNYLHFYQNLIEVCLNQGNPQGALHYAQALEQYTQAESLPWSDFYIARGRLLAQILRNGFAEAHRAQAQQLLEAAHKAGLYFGTGELKGLVKR